MLSVKIPTVSQILTCVVVFFVVYVAAEFNNRLLDWLDESSNPTYRGPGPILVLVYLSGQSRIFINLPFKVVSTMMYESTRDKPYVWQDVYKRQVCVCVCVCVCA